MKRVKVIYSRIEPGAIKGFIVDGVRRDLPQDPRIGNYRFFEVDHGYALFVLGPKPNQTETAHRRIDTSLKPSEIVEAIEYANRDLIQRQRSHVGV